MFENIINFFKKLGKKQEGKENKDSAKERLHLVLLQDRANVSADFLDMMKQEIIEVIKKYIDIDEKEIDVKLTNKQNSDGTTGAPALYANIPIVAIKSETRKISNKLNLEKMEKNQEEKNNNNKKDKNNASEKNTKSEESDSQEKNVAKEQEEQVIEKIDTENKDVKEDKQENNKEETSQIESDIKKEEKLQKSKKKVKK